MPSRPQNKFWCKFHGIFSAECPSDEGFNKAKKRTISIEVGMQNAGLATVLAGNFFAAQPLAVLPCAISCAWHSISGTILAGIFLKRDKQ